MSIEIFQQNNHFSQILTFFEKLWKSWNINFRELILQDSDIRVHRGFSCKYQPNIILGRKMEKSQGVPLAVLANFDPKWHFSKSSWNDSCILVDHLPQEIASILGPFSVFIEIFQQNNHFSQNSYFLKSYGNVEILIWDSWYYRIVIFGSI